jgi:hypothetical protein
MLIWRSEVFFIQIRPCHLGVESILNAKIFFVKQWFYALQVIWQIVHFCVVGSYYVCNSYTISWLLAQTGWPLSRYSGMSGRGHLNSVFVRWPGPAVSAVKEVAWRYACFTVWRNVNSSPSELCSCLTPQEGIPGAHWLGWAIHRAGVAAEAYLPGIKPLSLHPKNHPPYSCSTFSDSNQSACVLNCPLQRAADQFT